MSGRRTVRALAATALLVLAALLPGAGLLSAPASLSGPRTSAVGPTWGTDVVPVPAGAPAVSPTLPLRLEVSLAPRAADSLRSFDAALSAPASPVASIYLSEAQFEARYSPTSHSVATVEEYFAAHGAWGFSVTADRLGIGFTLTAAAAEQALGVPIVELGHSPSGAVVYSASRAPAVPPDLQGRVVGIGGLSDVGAGAVSIPAARVAGGSVLGPGQYIVAGGGTPWFIGTDFTRMYNASALFPPSAVVPNATFPTHEAVATILASGFNDSAQRDLAPYDPAAVAQYFQDTFPSAWPRPSVSAVPVSVAGLTPPPPGPLGALNDTTFDQVENSLDLEMAGSLAPGASIVDFYLAGSLINGQAALPVGDLADGFAQCLAEALSHNYSPARLVAVTNSYGLPDLNDSLWNSELAHAAALGVSIVAASGDQGNAPESLTHRFQGQWADWPASAAFDSYGAVAVGGTTLVPAGTANGSYGTSGLTIGYDAALQGIASEQVWYDTVGGTGSYAGSEGGLSLVYPEPSWQRHSAAQPAIVNATLTQGGLSGLMRGVPDVALIGNGTIVYDGEDAANNTTYFEVVEGTSIASPVFAGLLASLAAVAGHPFGFLDDELYRIASYFAQHPGAPGDPFQDVVDGANFLFSAEPGWDAATGFGGISALDLLRADGNSTVRMWNYTGASRGLPVPSTATTGAVSPLLLLVFGVALSSAAVLAIWALRPRPTARPPPAAPPIGAYAPPPPGTPLTSFPCPYCGAMRPAEPVRCPGCGAY